MFLCHCTCYGLFQEMPFPPNFILSFKRSLRYQLVWSYLCPMPPTDLFGKRKSPLFCSPILENPLPLHTSHYMVISLHGRRTVSSSSFFFDFLGYDFNYDQVDICKCIPISKAQRWKSRIHLLHHVHSISRRVPKR